VTGTASGGEFITGIQRHFRDDHHRIRAVTADRGNLTFGGDNDDHHLGRRDRLSNRTKVVFAPIQSDRVRLNQRRMPIRSPSAPRKLPAGLTTARSRDENRQIGNSAGASTITV